MTSPVAAEIPAAAAGTSPPDRAPPPLTIRGRDPSRAVTFPRGLLLAPMDGITDRTFRDRVLSLGHAGGACTEFVRISVAPVARKVLRRELGDAAPREDPRDVPGDVPSDVPVGVQLMAGDPEFVPESVVRAEAAGAAFIDLNFGCPVKRVVNKCAGSALLADPDLLAAIVSAAVGATTLPVTAKIRAGIDDDGPLDEVLDACASAGAAAVTVHARLRRHSYAEPAQWEWIARAVERLRPRGVPVVGNGGIDRGADAQRMLRETGCDAVMVGRAALADPWVFREACGGPPASSEEAADFALGYLGALRALWSGRSALPQFKRLVATYRAGGLFDGRDDERRALLRSADAAEHAAWFGRFAAAVPPPR